MDHTRWCWYLFLQYYMYAHRTNDVQQGPLLPNYTWLEATDVFQSNIQYELLNMYKGIEFWLLVSVMSDSFSYAMCKVTSTTIRSNKSMYLFDLDCKKE